MPGIAAFGALIIGLMAVAHLVAVIARNGIGTLRIRADEAGANVKLREGRPSELQLTLEVPTSTAIYGLELAPSVSETLEATLRWPSRDGSWGAGGSELPATDQLQLEVRGRRLGDAWLRGFEVSARVALGLYEVRVYSPCLVRMTVLPLHFAGGPPAIQATRAAADEQADLVHREMRGFGMEIRELRDFQAGDPFKHIAWSASARRGKLIAREFESDLQLSIWLLVDCSPSMFWGPPGEAKIDHALAIAADIARSLSKGRDRVGLVLHDHDTRHLVEPGHGSAHLIRLTQALLEAPHLVHEDRTELTESELTLRVARWFEVYRGRTFYLPPQSRPPPPEAPRPGPTLARSRTKLPERRSVPVREPHPRALRIDEAALILACRDLLDERFSRQRPVIPLGAYALEPGRSTLRAFARHFGISLPRDPTPRPGGQSHGLEAALQTVLSSRAHSGAHTLLSISDFHSADDLDALRRVALTARRHRHNLVFVMPTGDRGVLPAGSFVRRSQDAKLMAALVDVSALRATDNLRAAQAILRPAGATFVQAGAGESVARVMGRLRAVA